MAREAEKSIISLGRRYRPALVAFFVRRINDPAEAEDLAQDVLVKLMELSDGEIRNPGAYIFQIASNLVRDRYRRKVVRDVWLAGMMQRDDLAADYVDPLRLLVGRESMGQVAAVLADMAPRTREIFVLFRLERMRKREIASGYGISVSAVDKHLIKATAFLARRLAESRS